MKKNSTTYMVLAIILLISLIGGVIAIYTTANGPWGHSDPVLYISTARSLDRGLGLGYYEGNAKFEPITLEPPFYSIVLSAIGLSGVNLVAGARWLNVLAFVISIFISGWIFFRFSHVPFLGIVASVLMCVFPYMVEWFSSAYSEPLFILLFLSGGLCLLYYLQKENLPILLLSALLVGLLPGTRYAGIAMVFAGVLSVFLFVSGKFLARIKKAALFLLVSGLPILAWIIWIYFSTPHSVGGRSLGVDWSGLAAQFQAFRGIFMDTVWKWVPFQSSGHLLSYKLRFALMGAGFVIILVLSYFAQRQVRKDHLREAHNSGIHIFGFFGLSSLTFLAVLIATYLFTRPTIDVDNRMLLPLYVGIVMSLLGGFSLWNFAWFKGWLRVVQIVPWLVVVICVIWYFPQTRDKVEYYHPGQDLTAYHWNRSDIIQAVRDLPPDKPVISNDWELLLLWTGRPIYGFWNTFPSKPSIQTTSYGTNLQDSTQSVFCEQGAALVIFNDFPPQFRSNIGDLYFDQYPILFKSLSVYGKYLDGTIYFCH